jgi:hypothetical protein
MRGDKSAWFEGRLTDSQLEFSVQFVKVTVMP